MTALTLSPPAKDSSSAPRLEGAPVTTGAETAVYVPPVPKNLKSAGVNESIVEALILKYLVSVGSASGGAIAKELCLPNKPILSLLATLKAQQIVGYLGSAGPEDFNYTLTDAGRDRAQRYMRESMYVGPAPVSIEQYIEAVGAQSIARQHPQTEDLRRAFEDLLVNKDMLAALGPAINSGRGMFLYGSAGNGKSSIAERITKCFGDEVYIPKAVHVDGLIIKLFDPESHRVVETPQGGLLRQAEADERWVKICRPTLIVGGELTMDALEVRYDPMTKICEAPLQMKSNMGTFVIDDFGRQRMRPIELLNRWIVPLEKRYDYLILPNGKKVRIPFDQLIIFATNLEPKDLVDEAFLRRIPYKIHVVDPDEQAFRALFDILIPQMGFPPDPKAVDYFIETHYRKANRPFRCCQPRDILLQIRNHCLYQGKPLELTRENFDLAVEMYFTVM